MYLFLAFFAAVQPEPSYNEQVALAVADYNRYAEDVKPFLRYAAFHTIPEEIKSADVWRFIAPHLTTQQAIEKCHGVRIPDTLFVRIDLREMHWTLPAWFKVMEKYPYDLSGTGNPLFVRADWLLWVTSDGQLFSSYYDLLYAEKRFPAKIVHAAAPTRGPPNWSTTGGPRRTDSRPRRTTAPYVAPKVNAAASNFPANSTEFFEFWGVNPKANKDFLRAHIIKEGGSGVAFEERLIESLFAATTAWQTYDSASASGKKRPFNNLVAHPDFEAGEDIVGMEKYSEKTGEQFRAQAYLLTDGKFATVNEASGRIVTDSSDKVKIIRTPGSCIRCHTTGILPLPGSLVRSIIAKSGQIVAKSKEEAELINRRNLAKLDDRVKRDQEAFEKFVAHCTELSAAEVIGEYTKLLSAYDRPLDLEQAAKEVYAKDARELELALAYYSARVGPKPNPDNIELTTGERVPRDQWELSGFRHAAAALATWRARP